MEDDNPGLSMLLLAADAHWRAARWWTRAAAWVLGRHRLVRHLGCGNLVSVWRGTPYLLLIWEDRP